MSCKVSLSTLKSAIQIKCIDLDKHIDIVYSEIPKQTWKPQTSCSEVLAPHLCSLQISYKQTNSEHLHTKHMSLITLFLHTVQMWRRNLAVCETHPQNKGIFTWIPQGNFCGRNLNKDFFPPNRSCSSLRKAEKPAGRVESSSLWQLWQLARGAFHWSTSVLKGNYIDCRTKCLCGSLQRANTKGMGTRVVTPFRPHCGLPWELLAAVAEWQIPPAISTGDHYCGGEWRISPALMKLHAICSTLHKPFPKETVINPVSLRDLTAVHWDINDAITHSIPMSPRMLCFYFYFFATGSQVMQTPLFMDPFRNIFNIRLEII